MFLRSIILTILITTLAMPVPTFGQYTPISPLSREYRAAEAAQKEIDTAISGFGDWINDAMKVKFEDLPKSIQDHFKSMATTPETREALRKIMEDLNKTPEAVEAEHKEEFRRNRVSAVMQKEFFKIDLGVQNRNRTGKVSHFISGNGGFVIGMAVKHCSEAMLLGAWDPMTWDACYHLIFEKGSAIGLGLFSLSSQFAGSLVGRIPMVKNSQMLGPHMASGAGLAVGSLVNTFWGKAYASQSSTYLWDDLTGRVSERTKVIGKWFLDVTGVDRESYVQYKAARERHDAQVKEGERLKEVIKKNPKDEQARHDLVQTLNGLDYTGSRIDQYQHNWSRHISKTFEDTFKFDSRGLQDLGIHTVQLIGVVTTISVLAGMMNRYLNSEKFLYSPKKRLAAMRIGIGIWNRIPPGVKPVASELVNGRMVYKNIFGRPINRLVWNMFFSSFYVSFVHALRFLAVDDIVTAVRTVTEENLRALMSAKERKLEQALKDFMASDLPNHKRIFDTANDEAKAFGELWTNRISKLILVEYQERYAAWMNVFDKQNMEHTKRLNFMGWLTNSFKKQAQQTRTVPYTEGVRAEDYTKWLDFEDEAFVFNNGEKFDGVPWHAPLLYGKRLHKEIQIYLPEWNREILNKVIQARMDRGMPRGKARGISDEILPAERKDFENFLKTIDDYSTRVQEAIQKATEQIETQEQGNIHVRVEGMKPVPSHTPARRPQRPEMNLVPSHVTQQQLELERRKRRAFNMYTFVTELEKRQGDYLKWSQETHDMQINAKATEMESYLGYIIDGAFFRNGTPKWVKFLTNSGDVNGQAAVDVVDDIRNRLGLGDMLPEEAQHNRFFRAYWANENGQRVIKFTRNRAARIRYNLKDTLSYQFRALREVFLNLDLPDSNLTTELKNALWNQRQMDIEAHKQRREWKIDTAEVLKAIVNIADKTKDRERPFVDDQPTVVLTPAQKSDAVAYTLARLMTATMIEYRSLLSKRHTMLGYSMSGEKDITFGGPIHSNGKVIDPFGIEFNEESLEYKINKFLGVDPDKALLPLWELEKDSGLEKDQSDINDRLERQLNGPPTAPDSEPPKPPAAPPARPPQPPRPPNGRGR